MIDWNPTPAQVERAMAAYIETDEGSSGVDDMAAALKTLVPEGTAPVFLTQDQAEWLAQAARHGADDTIVPGAAAQLRELAATLLASQQQGAGGS